MASVASTTKAVSAGFATAGGTMTKLFTVPLIAVGAVALASAVDIDKANDIIRIATGATGNDLKKLEDSFKTVFKGVPNEAEAVGRAIGDLSVRTGLTGTALEGMATQMLNLATITGTDVNTLIPLTTRLFGDWSIATEDQSKTLDMLYKTSQQTGIGVASLAETVVQFGAPLRQLGFTIEQSTAMLGKWEKEGVNVSTVLTGMKFALKTFAREGIDAQEGMKKYTQAIKDAATPAEATGIAMKIFGMRAGPDMAAAIREGRFATDDLIKSIAASPDTINKAAWATFDFGEKFAILKHKAEVALEPIGKKLMDVLASLAPKLEKAAKGLEGIIDAFSKMSPKTQNTILAILGAVAAFGPLLVIIGKVAGGVSVLSTIIGALSGPIGWVILAIAALVAVGVLLYKNWDKVKEALKPVIDMFKTYVLPVLQQVWAVIKGSLLAALDNLKKAWHDLQPALKPLLPVLKAIAIAIGIGLVAPIAIGIAAIIAIVVVFAKIVEAVTWVIAQVTYFCTHFSEIMNSLPGLIGEALGNLVRFIIEKFTEFVAGAINIVRNLPGQFSDFINQLPGMARDAGSQLVEGFMSFISSLPDKISGIWSGIVDTISGWGSALWDLAKDVASSFWEGFKSGLYGSPKTKIEYALIDMIKNSGNLLEGFKADMTTRFVDLNFPTPAYAGGTSTIRTDREITRETFPVDISLEVDGRVVLQKQVQRADLLRRVGYRG